MRYVAAILLVLGSLAPVRADPCTCEDIPAFKRRIKEVTGYLEAYRKALADCYKPDAPRSFQALKERFDSYAFGGARPANIEDAGTVTPGSTNVSKKFEAMYCDTIVSAVNDVHEGDHQKFMWIHALPMLVGAAVGSLHFDPYTPLVRNAALTEVEAHEAEKVFLEQELQRLENACPRYKCRCDQKTYDTAKLCARSCPHASVNCVAPTCMELDPVTGKWNGRGI